MAERVPITDDMEVYRRILYDQVTEGKVNSYAFKLPKKQPGPPPIEYDPQISVEIAEMVTREECAARDGRPIFGVAGAFAGCARKPALDFNVCHDPEEGCFAHALISGTNNKTRSRLLAECMTVHIPPPIRTQR